MMNSLILNLNFSSPPPIQISNPNPKSSLTNKSSFFSSSFQSNFSQFCTIFRRNSRSSSSTNLHCVSSSDSFSSSSSSEFPLLPFGADEVLVPTESKTLHLYEARYLALLEKSLDRKKKLFVHFVLDPIITSGSSAGASFAARYGCLVLIENVERLEVGALVSIRGIGRVKIVNFVQADPYLIGAVIPLRDNVPDNLSKISSEVAKLKESLYQLNSLQIKLKASKYEPLQTHISNSLRWAEREPTIDCDEFFFPSLAERLSFAGLQRVSGSTEWELQALQKEKLKAMEIKETSERLEKTTEFVKKNISMVAAKLAIQSLEVQ